MRPSRPRSSIRIVDSQADTRITGYRGVRVAEELAPRARLGGEPTYVRACACGATFRNGLVVEAGGKVGLGPYPTQSGRPAASEPK